MEKFISDVIILIDDINCENVEKFYIFNRTVYRTESVNSTIKYIMKNITNENFNEILTGVISKTIGDRHKNKFRFIGNYVLLTDYTNINREEFIRVFISELHKYESDVISIIE